jgi:hypothetical protein
MTAPDRDYVSRRVLVRMGAMGLAFLAGLALFFGLRRRMVRIWFAPPADTP